MIKHVLFGKDLQVASFTVTQPVASANSWHWARGVLEHDDIPLHYMELSDRLEIVGVELKATWSQTK